jgi:hypothetical protein
MPNTRPDTAFVDGVCSACLSYQRRPQIDWDARKAELIALLDRHDGRCIVASSGGKDSHYIALTLRELGAEVTAVTATTCHLTPIGRRNIDNLARHVRTIEVTPNRTVRAKLNRLGLELVGDISWPEHVSIFTIPFTVSEALRIPLIFYGENPQDQYGGPLGSDEARMLTQRWRSEFGGFLGLRPSDLVGNAGLTDEDLSDYTTSAYHLKAEAHFLGQYIPWDSYRNAEVAKDAGMQWALPCQANRWPWENLDNAQTGLHDYFMWLKFGYGRGCAQISVDVRSGKVFRDGALGWVEKHDGILCNEYAGVKLEDVLDRIGLNHVDLKRLTIKWAACSQPA